MKHILKIQNRINIADWPYGICNATNFLENCVFYSDTFSLLYNDTGFDGYLRMYNKENCILLDYLDLDFELDFEFDDFDDYCDEECEKEVFKIQHSLYFKTFRLRFLTYESGCTICT